MKHTMNSRPRLVVVGGDAAGMSAASQARRLRDSQKLEIVALEQGEHTSYSACGIPYLVSGVVPQHQDLVARDPDTFRRDFAIDVRTGAEVTGIDLDQRSVTVRGTGGGHWKERFDHLMVATGAVPRELALPGCAAAGILGVQTLDDGIAARAFLDRNQPREAVVIGCGYIGLEMAEALVMRGIRVRVIDSGEEPMSALDPDMGRMVREALQSMGVEVHLRERVTGFRSQHDRVTGVLTAQGEYPAGVVILGTGVRPDSDLARGAGLDVGPTGGVAVDARMRTSAPGVWAAGDCVETFHRVARGPAAVPLGTHANKQGRVAGTNIGGGYARFEGVVGTAITKVCGLEVAHTGLNEEQAQRAGFVSEAVAVESTSRAGYYPGAERMTVKLRAERGSGRLLGGQIVGWENAGKRVDVLATALWNGMTVEDMAGMDLSYAPPFSPVWDPVLIAARKTAECC